MDRSTDQQLLADYVRANCEPAFREIVRRYARMVYQAAARQVVDMALADDVTQAVFLVLARRAHTIRDGRVLAAWLLKATHFAARNARLAESRRRTHEARAGLLHPGVDSKPEPDVRPILDAALLRLGTRDRAMVAQHYFAGQTFADIAATFDTTPEAARKRIARALDQLRKVLSAKGPLLSATAVAELLTNAAHPALPAHLSDLLLSPVAAAPTAAAVTISKGATTMMKLTQFKLTAAVASSTAAVALITAIAVAELDRPARSAANASAVAPATAPAAAAPAATQESPSAVCERRALDLLRAALRYSYDRKGRMPSTLSAAWRQLPGSERGLTPGVAAFYLCPTDPRAAALPKPITPQWLDQNTSFAYLAADLPNSIAEEKDLVVIHEKLDLGRGDTVVIAFANGTARSVPTADAEKLIEQSKQRLLKFRPLKRYKGEPQKAHH